MSVEQSFAVALHSVSVLACVAPKLVTASFIAENISVNPVVVRRTLVHLVKDGIVRSQPGLKGGYFLVHDPGKITLLDVLKAVRQNGEFTRRHGFPAAKCEEGVAVEKVLEKVFMEADQAMYQYFEKVTLGQVLAEAGVRPLAQTG